MHPLKETYDTYYLNAVYFALRIIGDPEESRDIVAEVFLSLLKEEYMPKGDARDAARVFTRTRSRCINFLRRKNVIAKYRVDAEITGERYALMATRPIDIDKLVLESLPRLTHREREIVIRSLLNTGTREIARRAGIQEITVRRFRQNAIEKIKEIVNPQLP